ncbi:MAG: hypothetical protein O3C69_04295, partial [Chloroflexi bacterium]|nr:hypothetical protein [Chloroflexota bacterium]
CDDSGNQGDENGASDQREDAELLRDEERSPLGAEQEIPNRDIEEKFVGGPKERDEDANRRQNRDKSGETEQPDDDPLFEMSTCPVAAQPGGYEIVRSAVLGIGA